MAFLCQRSPYLRTLKTIVKNCSPTEFSGKNHYKVILEDTILFPEGGGQPWDTGFINDTRVLYVGRNGNIAEHICESPLNIGDDVTCRVDWERRYDHMQQHTGQHLISAILDNVFKLATTSWELGSQLCNVELSTESISNELIKEAENVINTAIRESYKHPIAVHMYSLQEANEKIKAYSRNGLPADVAAPIRLIEIEGIDINACCGTHLSSLSELQIIKLLGYDKSRGKVRLSFICGNRVLHKLDNYISVERSLTEALSSPIDKHFELVLQLKSRSKDFDKLNKILVKEVAINDSKRISNCSSEIILIHLHRDFNDILYSNTIASQAVLSKSQILLITCGGPTGPGSFLLMGENQKLISLQPLILERFKGKGSVVKDRLRGRSEKIELKSSVLKGLIAELGITDEKSSVLIV